MASSEQELNLAEAALLVAAARYPGLDTGAYLARLDDLAEAVRRRVPGAHRWQVVRALNRQLFSREGFIGNEADYEDPRNSYLNEVIDRRVGLPITLAVLYMEVGWRLGVPFEGVAWPGHFLVKVRMEGGVLVLDPFAGGASIDEAALRLRARRTLGRPVAGGEPLRGLLVAASKKQILVRLLRNLKRAHLRRREPRRALEALDRMLLVNPRLTTELRARADLLGELGCYRSACRDYGRYLELEPEAPDADAVRRRISALEQAAPRLH